MKKKAGCGQQLVGFVIVMVIIYALVMAGRNNRAGTTNNNAATSAPSASFDEAAYESGLNTGLSIGAGGRNIVSIDVVDGRDMGGERIAMITYITTERTDNAIVDEYLDVLEAAAQSIRAGRMDIDTIGLVIGNSAGDAIATVVGQYNDIYAWTRGDMTRSALLGRLTVEDF